MPEQVFFAEGAEEQNRVAAPSAEKAVIPRAKMIIGSATTNSGWHQRVACTSLIVSDGRFARFDLSRDYSLYGTKVVVQKIKS